MLNRVWYSNTWYHMLHVACYILPVCLATSYIYIYDTSIHRVAFLWKGLLFNQKLIKTSRREAPDCGARREAPHTSSTCTNCTWGESVISYAWARSRFAFFGFEPVLQNESVVRAGAAALGVCAFRRTRIFMLRCLVTSKEPKINANTNTHTHDTRIAIAITLVNEEAFCSSCIAVVLIIISSL
jgi:hypothetical protein